MSSADASTGALARCVGDAGTFRSQVFGTAPHLQRGGTGFDDLLSLTDVDRLLTGHGLRSPAVRLVRDGDPLDPAGYTRSARTGRRRIDDLIDPGRVLDLHADGATVVLQSLQRWWPAITRFCRDLELALGHAVQANAYLTPAGAAGLAAHHDTHDVLVLQVHGTKRWLVREPVVRAPLERHTSDRSLAATQPPVLEARLAPGDALYLPRGFVHSAEAQAGVSLHITVGILATTVHDVLTAVVSRATGDARFRRSLPVGAGFDPGVATQAVKSAIADFAAWLDQLDPASVADDVRERFLTSRLPLLEGHLLEIGRLGMIADHTVVGVRPGTVHHRRTDGERLVLSLGDRHLELPAALEPALDRLLDGAPLRVGELAGILDHDSRLVLARRLVREGLLRIVPDV
ncbi:MAG TPA: cupin domain-containing protein [Acidimicrobiales bacterium]